MSARPEIEKNADQFRDDVARESRIRSLGAFVALAGAARGFGQRLDSWINTITGLGGSRDKTVATQIADFRPLTWRELDAMYHGEDLPAIIVDRLPTDALSAGFSFGDPDLDREAERWKLGQIVLEGRIWARLYGAGGVLIGSDDAPMDAPLRLKAIRPGHLRYLMPLDREDLSVAEYDTRPTSPTYGDPVMYRVGQQTVHPSRVVLFPGARTGSRARARLGGFDLSVLQRPYNVLRDTEHTWRSVMNLLGDMSQAVFGIKGLTDMIANGQKDVVLDRMRITDVARSVARAVVIDAEGETYQHVGAANVTGVDPLLVRVFTRLATAADMPLTLLAGTSPAGLNATGESDLAIWYKKCAGERKLLQPGIHFLGAVIARNAGLPAPEGVIWPKLWELSETEQAATDGARATAAKTRIDAQITTPDEEARVLAGESLADVLGDRPDPITQEADPEPVDEGEAEDYPIAEGSLWTDTVDGHRIEVTRTSPDRVYFRDLDSDTPARQWSWKRGPFLERCMPQAVTQPDALPSPDGPTPDPTSTPPT